MAADMGTAIGLRRSGLIWSDLEGEVVILDLSASTYFSLNETGSLLWHHLDQPSSFDTLVQALVDGFVVPTSQAEGDVHAFLETLDSHGLIERL